MSAPLPTPATAAPPAPTRPSAGTGAGVGSFGSSTGASSGAGPASPSPDAVSLIRQRLTRAGDSYTSVPPEGAILTGKQEHYLKRELLSQQTRWEITELASPTALQRFGAPFRSDVGEVAPQHSELPLLRYIFVNHVRNFPFLDQAKEKEFWQDKLQLFLESFATKNISGSEDRAEDTKRKKLAVKAEKLVELMMVSGIPTSSGYEERIRFSEMEVVDRGANEGGLIANAPDGHKIHGWDVNIASVRTTAVKRHVRYHEEPEYIIKVAQSGKDDIYVARTYDAFRRMHKRVRLELPGKVLPPLPRHSTSDQSLTYQDEESDAESFVSAQNFVVNDFSNTNSPAASAYSLSGIRNYLLPSRVIESGHKRSSSTGSQRTPRASADLGRSYVLYRETSRVSLRAALRTLLQNDRVAQSSAMREFLTSGPVQLNEEEMTDAERRKELDERRIREQRQFYEVARARAAELDVHMEKFRRDVVENNGLTNLFDEIKKKKKLEDLAPEYKKFAEWVRIEVAATIYHLFLAEDNSPELFAQAKRIHSLIPYSVVKNVIRYSNPTTVMSAVLDLFLMQPFGARSLLQRIFGMAISDGIMSIQKSIDILISQKIEDSTLAAKIKQYTESDSNIKEELKEEAKEEHVDVLVCIMRSAYFEPAATPEQIQKVHNGFVAWQNVVENAHLEMRHEAELFAHLRQLLKLYMRQRDKAMMLQMIEEPVTLRLFRDLFQIFYEPLVRVYKSANVYNSILDWAAFVDDAIRVVEAAQRQDFSADPNQTVQAFIDLCARHEHNLYKFVHEVHTHDNGLFVQLMGWLEGILRFLKEGPRGRGLGEEAAADAGRATTQEPQQAPPPSAEKAPEQATSQLLRPPNGSSSSSVASAAAAASAAAVRARRRGAPSLDMNCLLLAAVDRGAVDERAVLREVNALIRWQMARKKWHLAKTRQKMAAEGDGGEEEGVPGVAALLGGAFHGSDFGLNEMDLDDLDDDSSIDSLSTDDTEDYMAVAADPIGAEQRRRARQAERERLRRSAGEPAKPNIEELGKLMPDFLVMLREVLAE